MQTFDRARQLIQKHGGANILRQKLLKREITIAQLTREPNISRQTILLLAKILQLRVVTIFEDAPNENPEIHSIKP